MLYNFISGWESGSCVELGVSGGLTRFWALFELLSLCRVIGRKERLREGSLAAKLKGAEILVPWAVGNCWS